MDILKNALWNELRSCLKAWDEMNEKLQRGEGNITKAEHTKLRYKIQDLESRLGDIERQEKAS